MDWIWSLLLQKKGKFSVFWSPSRLKRHVEDYLSMQCVLRPSRPMLCVNFDLTTDSPAAPQTTKGQALLITSEKVSGVQQQHKTTQIHHLVFYFLPFRQCYSAVIPNHIKVTKWFSGQQSVTHSAELHEHLLHWVCLCASARQYKAAAIKGQTSLTAL